MPSVFVMGGAFGVLVCGCFGAAGGGGGPASAACKFVMVRLRPGGVIVDQLSWLWAAWQRPAGGLPTVSLYVDSQGMLLAAWVACQKGLLECAYCCYVATGGIRRGLA